MLDIIALEAHNLATLGILLAAIVVPVSTIAMLKVNQREKN